MTAWQRPKRKAIYLFFGFSSKNKTIQISNSRKKVETDDEPIIKAVYHLKVRRASHWPRGDFTERADFAIAGRGRLVYIFALSSPTSVLSQKSVLK
ncbi:MAG: hypothetical protein Q8P67_09080 [archaeon]|nr:hypothetical protein [archaeon]